MRLAAVYELAQKSEHGQLDVVGVVVNAQDPLGVVRWADVLLIACLGPG